MELAARNPSLGGRGLLQEIIERGPMPEETERPQAQNPRAALVSHEPGHPDYRTLVEQANWLNEQSQTARDLYEHGAEIKGEVLVIPAEEYELSEERETPFITTLSYALEKIDDIERAREFHELALAISGETADARTQIAVFKTYHDRLTRSERGDRYRQENEAERAQALTLTLAAMRLLAAEMAKLETRESLDVIQPAEGREDDIPEGRMNATARRISLRDESLRLPAGLSYEQKERLVSITIPEIDLRLERGISRETLFKAIDRAMFRPDPAEYLRKLAELADRSAGETPERPMTKEEYLESQRTLLQLCERERLHLREVNELEPYEEARLSQVENLTRRLGQGLGRNVSDVQLERAAHSQLFVSLPERGVGENAFRLPVNSVRVYKTMAKIAAGEKLSLQTWAGNNGPEVRLELTERETDERSRIGAFLKNYVDERLRDPETRALNRSSVFRDARAAIFNATTPETLGRVAADLLRVNERRSEELRLHRSAPEKHPLPSVMPLNSRERNLLFNGRAPDRHTPEMRELRLNYGLSRRERADRVAGLREGRIDPSEALKTMLEELATRKTARAIAHFQASLINEKMNRESAVNIHSLGQRIPPHERTYLYELSEERKRELIRLPSARQSEIVRDKNKIAEPPFTRAFGAMPRENHAFREYMASMGRIERQLLNEALIERGIEFARLDSQQRENSLTITEARALLPESLQRGIRLRARNQAWQSLVPEEAFDRNALPEAARISDTIAHIQEHLQERASIAQTVRNDFIGDGRRLAELDRYAAQTREDVYRAFELLDVQRRDLELVRARNGEQIQKEEVLDRVTSFRPEIVKTTESVRLPAPLRQQISISDAELQTEHVDLRSEEAISTSVSMYVSSDQEWRFDSLREVLNDALSRVQSEDKGHEIGLHRKSDDLTREH